MAPVREEERLLFDRMPGTLPLYEAFREQVLGRLDGVELRVSKTQITFRKRYGFAVVSLPVRRRREWPKVCVVVTLGLARRLDDPRVVQAVEPYPGRWTNHVLVSVPAEVDGQLLDWVEEAYWFSESK